MNLATTIQLTNPACSLTHARHGMRSAAHRIAFTILVGSLASGGAALAQPCINSPDFDGDGRVDACDLILFERGWVTSNPSADLNCDGNVNQTDLLLFSFSMCPDTANPPQPQAAPMGTATIGVYSDPAGTTASWPDGPPFVPIHYYVVAHGVTADIGSYLFGLDVPPSFFPMDGSDFTLPAGFSLFQNPGSPGAKNYLVSATADSCLSPVNGTVLLAHFTAISITGTNLAITVASPDMTGASCMAPADFSSYISCGDGCNWIYFAPDLQTTCGGQVFRDFDGDCVRDPDEPGLAGRTVILEPGASAATTDANGWYFFSLPAPGQYTVQAIPFPNWTALCPANATHVFDIADLGTVTGLHFGTVLDPGIHDLGISVAAGRARQGRAITYALNVGNWGSESENPATATLALPPEVTYLDSSDGGSYDALNHAVSWTLPMAVGERLF
ncbi:MAG: hypothetical protein IPH09_11480, partial [bacterium]|nr:hypothetical protein [bacterium]